jgi:hypothetical protein
MGVIGPKIGKRLSGVPEIILLLLLREPSRGLLVCGRYCAPLNGRAMVWNSRTN